MSALTSSIVAAWSGRLDVGERVLELALPRACPGRTRGPCVAIRARVQPDELGGDLLDRLLGAALGLGPVAAAHLGQARRLAAHVLGHLVELVAGHEQPVAGLAALAARVLDHQVLARRRVRARADGPLHELDEPADAVLLVHHVVARPQLQRVDDVAPAARHPAHVARAACRRARSGRTRRTPPGAAARPRTPARRRAGTTRTTPPSGSSSIVATSRAGTSAALAAARPCAARGRAPRWPARAASPPAAARARRRPRGRPRRGSARRPAPRRRPCARSRRGRRPSRARRRLVAGGRVARAASTPRRSPRRSCAASAASTSSVNGLSVHQPSPRTAESARTSAKRREARRGQVQRRRRARGRRRPRGREELLRRRDEVVRPPPHPLGVDHHEQAVVAARGPAPGTMRSTSTGASDSMPSTAMPCAEPVEHVRGAGQLRDQLDRPRADGVRQQDLPARRRPHAVLGHLEAALVRHGEPADLLDVLAPQLDAQRVVLGGREHVDDPAAHRELAAPLDHVDARVRGARQPLAPASARSTRSPVLIDTGSRSPSPSTTGCSSARTGHDEHADRARRSPSPSGCASRRNTAEPPGDRVAARRQALVRQRLPRGQHRDVVGGQVAAQRGGELVGVAARRRDDDQRALLRQRRQQRRADAGRADDVELAAGAHGVDRLARRRGRRGGRGAGR